MGKRTWELESTPRPNDSPPNCCHFVEAQSQFKTRRIHNCGFRHTEVRLKRCSACGCIQGEWTRETLYDPILDISYGVATPRVIALNNLAEMLFDSHIDTKLKEHLQWFLKYFVYYGITEPDMALPYRHGDNFGRLAAITDVRIARKVVTLLWRICRIPPLDGCSPHWHPTPTVPQCPIPSQETSSHSSSTSSDGDSDEDSDYE